MMVPTTMAVAWLAPRTRGRSFSCPAGAALALTAAAFWLMRDENTSSARGGASEAKNKNGDVN